MKRVRAYHTVALLGAVTALTLTACGQGTGGAGGAETSATPIPTQGEQTPTQQAGEVTGTVWVANEDGNSLTAIDAETSEVATTVTGIEAPHNVQVGPDGTVWAVSGHSNALVALDPATYQLTGTAATGQSPAHVILTPDGARVYVTNAGEDTLGVYDAATLDRVATVEVGDGPHGLRPSGNGEVVVVANTGAGTIDVVQIFAVLCQVRDPGNAGTVLRAADAAGCGCGLHLRPGGRGQ